MVGPVLENLLFKMRLLRSYDQTKSIFSCFRFIYKIYTMDRTLRVLAASSSLGRVTADWSSLPT